MDLGMIGLGRMGASMAERLMRGGHRVVGFDPDEEARRAVEGQGGESVTSLEALLTRLPAPRTLWMMVPAGSITEETVAALASLLTRGDRLIDGGNSNYQDSMRRGLLLQARHVHYVDVGTSGGVWGVEKGYCLMVGGEVEVIGALEPIFEALAPHDGWGRVGPSGAGHFTKMIHNGIEYGMMQALAEGFSMLAHKEELGLDVHQIAALWRHGSVVRSWLLDLTATALRENPTMEGIPPQVEDTGEGRWAAAEAISLDVPAPVITHALIARLRSRDTTSFADRLITAMRHGFGGQAIIRG